MNMFKCINKEAKKLLGKGAFDGSSLSSKDGDTYHFLVTDSKQPNYLKHCNRVESAIDAISTINKYTDHTTQHFAKINLALASDSNKLEEYKDYVPQLRAAILSQPLLEDCILYRGVDLSDIEMAEMERLKTFYIPSFTSTSVDPTRAYKKLTTMVIKVPYGSKYACSITEQLSKYHSEEKEILLSCYSAFHLERVERDNGTTILSLFLDEHLTAQNYLSPCI